jgi:predicted lipoprotein with Yx(FWY)xxD motif
MEQPYETDRGGIMRRNQTRIAAPIVLVAVLVVTAALAGSTAAQASTVSTAGAVVKISTGNVPGLGTVLVDARGRTLYMFVPDKHSRVTCVGTCAAIWPPVKLPSGGKPVAAGHAKTSLLGSDRSRAGGRVVTYAGWPLYTYVADTHAGVATGQALNLNGGLWYVLAPSGKIDRTKVA